MTGAEILTAFRAIGATVRLTPAGIVDVDSPAVPEFDRLVAEVRANRAEVVNELKRHAVPALPGRAERPCIGCDRQCREGELFHDGECFETWKARRRHARLTQDARSATAAARGIPAGTNAPGGAA